MLEATIVLEVVLGNWLDAQIVLEVLIGNTAIGFVQEGRATAAVALLRSRLEVSARVSRDGAWSFVPSAELHPRRRPLPESGKRPVTCGFVGGPNLAE